jgi:hypothetical protein
VEDIIAPRGFAGEDVEVDGKVSLLTITTLKRGETPVKRSVV